MIMALSMTMALSAVPVSAAEFTDGSFYAPSGLSVQEGMAFQDTKDFDCTAGHDAGNKSSNGGWREDPFNGKYFYYNETGEFGGNKDERN